MELHRRFSRFDSRLDNLGKVFRDNDRGAQLTTPEIYLIEHSIVQLQIEWELYVRDLILDSATGKFLDSSGQPVFSRLARIRNREVAGHFLVSQYPRRNYEPDWYLPSEAIDAAIRLDLSNMNNISVHLGITPWKLDDLRFLRNFVSHRSKRSARTLRSSGNVTANNKVVPWKLAYSYSNTGSKKYEDWIHFMKFVARGLVS